MQKSRKHENNLRKDTIGTTVNWNILSCTIKQTFLLEVEKNRERERERERERGDKPISMNIVGLLVNGPWWVPSKVIYISVTHKFILERDHSLTDSDRHRESRTI